MFLMFPSAFKSICLQDELPGETLRAFWFFPSARSDCLQILIHTIYLMESEWADIIDTHVQPKKDCIG